ncbi:MAG TPA: L-threonylcarbamoyladenylate synthase [Candidatus Polarisedimenticolaceae bacterium]|nr:L-threonylcarbamoyladenylate synthase [Candidatus Polarisedimenticolaceae bacterium]
MATRLLPVDPEAPSEDALSEGVRALRAGGIVAVPTETFYGLAADPFLPGTLAAVNRLKEKDATSPILLLLADLAQAAPLMAHTPRAFPSLAALWPAPLTLVVPASAAVPPEISGGQGTVGIRVPGLALPRLLAQRLGHAITGVSANRTGKPAPTCAADVLAAFPEGLALVLDGGATAGAAPSTLVDLTAEPPRLLREGALPWAALRDRL